MSEKQNNSQELKKKTSLYAIISVCLLIAGAASYVTAKRNIAMQNESPDISADITSQIQTQASADSKVNEIVSGIADDRTDSISELSTQSVTAEEKTAKAEKLIIRAEAFTLPIDSPVLKKYSDAQIVYSKTTDDWRSHNGIDFSGKLGDPVIAVNNGIVTDVYDDTLWGTVVEIDHGEGLIARYCGLGRGSTVNVGDEVKINQRIGNLSEVPIEKADGVHLHFETTLDGITVNPIIALGMNENDVR